MVSLQGACPPAAPGSFIRGAAALSPVRAVGLVVSGVLERIRAVTRRSRIVAQPQPTRRRAGARSTSSSPGPCGHTRSGRRTAAPARAALGALGSARPVPRRALSGSWSGARRPNPPEGSAGRRRGRKTQVASQNVGSPKHVSASLLRAPSPRSRG